MRVGALVFLLVFSILAGALAYLLIYVFFPLESRGMGYGIGSQPRTWIPIIVVPITFTAGFLGYLALFPEIQQKPSSEAVLSGGQTPLEPVLRVLKEDERKVVELLMNAGGTMLQRDITRKTGFTRVKTHRILYRLSTRGVVTAKKYFNTYEITLSDWLW